MKELNIFGNKIFSKNQILSEIFILEDNNYYNPVLLRKKLQLLKNMYLENGKVDINIIVIP